MSGGSYTVSIRGAPKEDTPEGGGPRSNLLNIPFPLRSDFVVSLLQVPRDLSAKEASRLAAFIRTLATDFEGEDAMGEEEEEGSGEDRPMSVVTDEVARIRAERVRIVGNDCCHGSDPACAAGCIFAEAVRNIIAEEVAPFKFPEPEDDK